MSRAFWRRLRRQDDDPGVSFAWPRDTDLTREQIEIAMRESAASPSQPDAGRTVVTTALDAPRPQTVRLLVGVPAEAVEALMMDPPPGVVSVTPYDDLSAEEQAEWREAYHAPRPQQWRPGPTPVLGGVVGEVDPEPGGAWTLVSSNEPNVWGEGVQGPAALLDYAVSRQELREMEAADRLRNPDAFDSKRRIHEHARACRGDCGDGPSCYEEWAR